MTIALADDMRDAAYATPLDKIDVSDPALYQNDTIWPYFERLRREDPVHYCSDSAFGPYWSITKYRDIMLVDTSHSIFSSEAGGITILDRKLEDRNPNFISMDPPKHDEQRKTVSPIVAPQNLANLEGLIREPRLHDSRRSAAQRDVQLGRQGLDRTHDADAGDAVRLPVRGAPHADLLVRRGDDACRQWMTSRAGRSAMPSCSSASPISRELWNERVNKEPALDLISMLAHSPATRDMAPREFLGNLILLIVGGNDTTRNSITGGLWS